MTNRPVTPDFIEVLSANRRQTLMDSHCVMVGVIQSFNTTTQTATITYPMRQVVKENPDGSFVIREYPESLECPVFTMFGGDSFINVPISAGDYCIVLFADRDISYWQYNGDEGVPQSSRLHDITDAIALVGIRPFRKPIGNFLSGGIRIFLDGQNSMDFTSDGVTLNATKYTVNATDIEFVSETLTHNGKNIGDDHAHSGVQIGGSNTGAPI